MLEICGSAREGAYLPEWSVKVRRHILRHTLTAGHANYEALWFREATPLLEFHPLATSGREAPPNGRIDRVGLLFLEYQTESALKAMVAFLAAPAIGRQFNGSS
jgi:hypothetical protein